MRFGAIDIGTNAARLLIGEVIEDNGRQFVNKISYTRIPLRLGEEVFTKGKISKEKAKDFKNTIKAFALLADVYEIETLRACATSAMREASNGLKLQEEILKSSGVNIEIISGEEEANLIFSTFFLLDIDNSKPFIVVDVGGGSTEISLFINGIRTRSKSFDVGTIRLLKNKTNPSIWDNIRIWIKENVLNLNIDTIYATGGNINKAQKMIGVQAMSPIQKNQIIDLYNLLEPLTISQRIEHFQLKPDRADVIILALDIYKFIMTESGIEKMIVPKIGLSDGIIYDLHKKHISAVETL